MKHAGASATAGLVPHCLALPDSAFNMLQLLRDLSFAAHFLVLTLSSVLLENASQDNL